MRDRMAEARSMVEEERVSKKEISYGVFVWVCAHVCVYVCVCVLVCVCVCVCVCVRLFIYGELGGICTFGCICVCVT